MTAILIGEKLPAFRYIVLAMLLEFLAYGLSIFLYIRAQRNILLHIRIMVLRITISLSIHMSITIMRLLTDTDIIIHRGNLKMQ